jgi:hypothetical protein
MKPAQASAPSDTGAIKRVRSNIHRRLGRLAMRVCHGLPTAHKYLNLGPSGQLIPASLSTSKAFTGCCGGLEMTLAIDSVRAIKHGKTKAWLCLAPGQNARGQRDRPFALEHARDSAATRRR